MLCPACGAKNIEGDDSCTRCGAALTDLSTPKPRSVVERMIWRDTIHALEPRKPLEVGPDDSIRSVVERMVEKKIGCAFVVEGRSLAGIFTERDALKRVGARFPDMADLPIKQVMTPSPGVLEQSDKIAFALHRMDLGGYRHVPVLRDGAVKGLISVRDVLRYISKNLFEAV